jgi:hypothetical protein
MLPDELPGDVSAKPYTFDLPINKITKANNIVTNIFFILHLHKKKGIN